MSIILHAKLMVVRCVARRQINSKGDHNGDRRTHG
jgi:hypothetical protein